MRKHELKLWLIADSGHRFAMLLMLRIIRGVSLPLIAKNQIICSKHLSISYNFVPSQIRAIYGDRIGKLFL